jgi:hypothetical protein
VGDTREGYLVLSVASPHALRCPSRRPPLPIQKEPGTVSHGVPTFHPQRVHQISNEACVESKNKGMVSGLLLRLRACCSKFTATNIKKRTDLWELQLTCALERHDLVVRQRQYPVEPHPCIPVTPTKYVLDGNERPRSEGTSRERGGRKRK